MHHAQSRHVNNSANTLRPLNPGMPGDNGFYIAIFTVTGGNAYGEEDRQAALCLSKAVYAGQKMAEAGEKDADKIVSEMVAIIEAEPLAKIDYVSAVDGVTMADIHEINGPALFAMAVYIGKTRLIDNFIVE